MPVRRRPPTTPSPFLPRGPPSSRPPPINPLSSMSMSTVFFFAYAVCWLLVVRRLNAPPIIKTHDDIACMRHAGRQGAEVLEYLAPHVKAGVSTGHLDRLAYSYITDVQGGVPAPLHYGGVVGGLLSRYEITRSVCVAAHAASYSLLNGIGVVVNGVVSLFTEGAGGVVSDSPSSAGAGAGAGVAGVHFGIPLCGFPKSVCTALNNVAVHGVPSDSEVLQAGDILNIDVTVITGKGDRGASTGTALGEGGGSTSASAAVQGGCHGDTSRMFYVGHEDEDVSTGVAVGGGGGVGVGGGGGVGAAASAPPLSPANNEGGNATTVMAVAHTALWIGIHMVRPGATTGDIGAAIQSYVEGSGYSVIKEYGGHGIGQAFHEPPFIPHHGQRGAGTVLEEGMVMTIEPMVNAGGAAVRCLSDQWTVVTADGALSAQWEHTVLVTQQGCEVLTMRKGERPGKLPQGVKDAWLGETTPATLTWSTDGGKVFESVTVS